LQYGKLFLLLVNNSKKDMNIKNEYSALLKQLSVNVTPQDKKDAVDECGLSMPTVNNYLNGTVIKIDTAEKLVLFFKGKVRGRTKLLRQQIV